jgi:hypothetical protein
MLHRKTVSAELLGLLKSLMKIPAFSKMRLVGGTALALQLGHRSSIDIDLFGEHQLDDHQLSAQLSDFEEVVAIGGSSSIKAFFINDIKVDIVNYQEPMPMMFSDASWPLIKNHIATEVQKYSRQ